MKLKSIEIYYDIDTLPGVPPGDMTGALAFRNEAMGLIEHALDDYGAGAWEGAEIGMGVVNFGFSVADFDAAESIVREAVADTRFCNIRNIARNEVELADF